MIHPTAPALRRRYADWAHGQIHYYDSGGEGVPLVLLHQSPASSSDWFPLIPPLRAAGVRVIAIDTPGMGLSDPLPHAPVIADYADAVAVVLDDAGVATADLLGHHTGAQIATALAVRHPARVRSVALYGAPVMDEAQLAALWQDIVPNELDGAIHRPVSGGTNLGDHFRRVEALFNAVVAQRLVLSALLAGPLWWHGHNAALRDDMVPSLIKLRQPLLLMSHPGEMLEAHTLAAARLRPDATYVSLAARSSVAMDDAADDMAERVVRFLRGVGPGASATRP